MQVLLAAPLGLRAKSSVAARNATLLAGMAALVGADLCFAFLPSLPGERHGGERLASAGLVRGRCTCNAERFDWFQAALLGMCMATALPYIAKLA